MCNYAVTAPLQKEQASTALLSERMQDFDLFAGRKYTQKVDCGSLSRLQDPYEWR